jgi:basic membrane protein A and related proteins
VSPAGAVPVVLLALALAGCAPPAAAPTAAPKADSKPAASPSPAAASPAASPSPSPSPAAAPPAASPSPAAAVAKASRELRVGLVTDIGKIDDRSFNQSAWEGVQRAQRELGANVRFIETTDPKDYAKNIDQFAQDNYDVIVTVGFALSDATITAAKQYANIKFIGVDQFQDTTITNLAGLVFDEDKAGYLAGYLAGELTKSGTVGQVLGTPVVPPVEKFGVGYISGAKDAKAGVKVLSACHPGGLATGFNDPQWGRDTTIQEMNQGADVIFAAGGNTGNGGLLAIADRGGSMLGIGVDTDQYFSLPEAKSILVSSAMKLITPGVFNLIKAGQDGSFKGGNVVGQVGLAPYHDLQSRVPADVQAKMQQIQADVVAGKVDTRWSKPTGNCPQG